MFTNTSQYQLNLTMPSIRSPYSLEPTDGITMIRIINKPERNALFRTWAFGAERNVLTYNQRGGTFVQP